MPLGLTESRPGSRASGRRPRRALAHRRPRRRRLTRRPRHPHNRQRQRARRAPGSLHGPRRARGTACDREMSGAPATRPDGVEAVAVRDNPERGRYEAYVGSALAGYTDYHASARPSHRASHRGRHRVRGARDRVGARPPHARRHPTPERDGAPGLPLCARVPATPSGVRRRSLEAVTAGLPRDQAAITVAKGEGVPRYSDSPNRGSRKINDE